MKIGIIRCMQTEDFCPGTADFKMIRDHKGGFEAGGGYHSLCILHQKRDAYRISVSHSFRNDGGSEKSSGR